jgi:hypothetical protein
MLHANVNRQVFQAKWHVEVWKKLLGSQISFFKTLPVLDPRNLDGQDEC